jgi:hypothetical protein
MLDGNGASLTDRCVCWCWLDWRLRDGFADIRAGRHVTGYLGRRGDMGLQFGGAPTLQTALADAAGDGADVAQSALVTVFNLVCWQWDHRWRIT